MINLIVPTDVKIIIDLNLKLARRRFTPAGERIAQACARSEVMRAVNAWSYSEVTK